MKFILHTSLFISSIIPHKQYLFNTFDTVCPRRPLAYMAQVFSILTNEKPIATMFISVNKERPTMICQVFFEKNKNKFMQDY